MKLAVFFIFIFSQAAGAFEVAPEYTFFNESEAQEFSRPENITGEYFSDVTAFRRTLHDPAQRWNLTNHYDLVLGSLSSKEFFNNQKIFLRKNLSEKFEARLIWFQDQDFEQDHSQFTIELIYWLHPQWGLAVNGSPAFAKSDDDMGVALINSSWWGGESRLYAHFPDFQRNKRAQNQEEFAGGRAPMALGFISRSQNHEVGFRYEKPVEWLLPQENRRSFFKRTTAQVKKWFEVSETQRGAMFLFFENKFEGESPLGGGTITEEFRRRERGSAQIEWSQMLGGHELLAGTGYHFRQYRVGSEKFKIENILPYAWWNLPWKGSSIERRWRLGLDSAFHDTTGAVTFLNQDVDTYRIDSRLNVVYELRAQESWSLSLLFTFDVDRGQSDTPWEGGAGQFRIFF